MQRLKLLFQKLQIRPSVPRRDSRPPGALLKTVIRETSGGIWAIAFQGETDERLLLGAAWDKNTAIF